jgi:hypothetical protein
MKDWTWKIASYLTQHVYDVDGKHIERWKFQESKG